MDSLEKTPRPVRLRFSLLALLILIALICIGLSLYLADAKRKADAKAFANTIPDANPPTFACAQAESDGSLTIIQSLPSYGYAKTATPRTRIPPGTEVTEESYGLLIPSTKEIELPDGSTRLVDKTRFEVRQRRIPIASGPEEKLITYHARLAYRLSVIDEAGTSRDELRYRDELRNKLIGKDEQLLIESLPIAATLDPDDLSFFRLNGTPMSTQAAMARFQSRQPVLVVNGKTPYVSLYFRRLLHPNTVIVLDTDDQLTRRLMFVK